MCPHLGGSSVDAIYDAREDNSTVRLALTLEVPDHRPSKAPTWDRCIQSVDGISPSSDHFLQVTPDYGDMRDQVPIRVSLFGLSPQCINLV